MTPNSFKLTDVVALLRDVPSHGLRRGQVGTVAEQLPPRRDEIQRQIDAPDCQIHQLVHHL